MRRKFEHVLRARSNPAKVIELFKKKNSIRFAPIGVFRIFSSKKAMHFSYLRNVGHNLGWHLISDEIDMGKSFAVGFWQKKQPSR